MIGYMVWRTGSSTHPVAFVYARNREHCKVELQSYLLKVPHTNFYNPDNWTIEPVTREQEYVTQALVICPDITKHE